MTEFANKGAVKSYLTKKTKADISPSQLVQMALDTAEGMSFMSRLNIVHRDLAVRNLLCSEVENKLIVKVADFGLSRKSTGDTLTISDHSADPVRWAAPETFTAKVSVQSDVWSFAVTVWEIFTFCHSDPYPGLSNSHVKQTVTDGKDVTTYFLLKDCPDGVNELLKSCFLFEPTERPTFIQITKILKDIIQTLEDTPSLNTWKLPDEVPTKEEAVDLGEGTYEVEYQNAD